MVDVASDWFIREILCHEAALTRFIARAWPHPADVLDIRHDAYVRVYEAALRSRPHSPKSFLFTTARNVMADRARRLRIVSMDLVENLDALNVLVDEATPERRMSGRQQLAHLTTAFNRLPPRCREVVWLQRVDGMAMKEIAARLGIALGTVEKHAFNGIRLLAEYFYGEELAKTLDPNLISDRESHGRK